LPRCALNYFGQFSSLYIGLGMDRTALFQTYPDRSSHRLVPPELGGMAHFVAITLAFVQQSSRENLRERYTTNVVLPCEMSKRLRAQLYLERP